MRRTVLYLLTVLLLVCAVGVVLQTYRLQQRCTECCALVERIGVLQSSLRRLREHYEQQIAAHAMECRTLRAQLGQVKTGGGAPDLPVGVSNGVGQAALDYCDRSGGAVGHVFKAGIQWREYGYEAVNRAIEDSGSREAGRMKRSLRGLSAVAGDGNSDICR